MPFFVFSEYFPYRARPPKLCISFHTFHPTFDRDRLQQDQALDERDDGGRDVELEADRKQGLDDRDELDVEVKDEVEPDAGLDDDMRAGGDGRHEVDEHAQEDAEVDRERDAGRDPGADGLRGTSV